jgi:TatA/E family protein of Tat protein translocase
MFDIGVKEIIIIAVILLVLFGSSKIPLFARNLVEAVRTLRKAFSDDSMDSTIAKKK